MSENSVSVNIIARMRSDFTTKFGIPRQSGLVDALKGEIIFEPAYRVAEAFRGIEGYSHLWLLWQFSQAVKEDWSPTVRPPRLGGNTRMGVFATRSPFRPNHIGLSCVRLDALELSADYGPVLHVSGADLMDGTPIFDIKPYIPYADSRPEAAGGFTDVTPRRLLRLDAPQTLLSRLPPATREALAGVLQNDPRPSYQDDPRREYGFLFAGYEVKFRVEDGTAYLLNITPAENA